MRRDVRHWGWAAAALITIGAAALRLIDIGGIAPDPFYDAAVRSMALSWHNFFFGAFEPGGSVSIDKPPLDLWLQVASVKLFGFTPTSLKLPEALAGVAAVPLLYAAVRRVWGIPAGLAAALALAVLPVEVITSRSDTMDGLMMALIVLAMLLIVHAGESGRTGWLLGAAAAMGAAFNVKLLESVVALPALAIFAYLALPAARRRRLLQLAGAAAVYVAVALSWLTATLLASNPPYAIGSTDGSAWNAAFVFNGTERLGGKSPEAQFSAFIPGHHYPEATQAERDQIPIVPPSSTRLLARIGPLSGERLGLEVLVGVLFGLGALLALALVRPGDRARAPDRDTARMRRAMAIGLGVWLACGIVLFSAMARLHPRYVEAFVPAVAASLGIGAAWAASARGRARLIVLTVAMVVVVIYADRLLYGRPPVWWITLAGALGAIAAAALARAPNVPAGVRARLAPAVVLGLTLLAVLAIPLKADVTAIEERVSDAGYVGALPAEEQRLTSAYLRAHEGHARYEVAAESATQIGSLIVQDARPVLVLTTYNARVYTTVARLRRLIASGQVRYAFLTSTCPPYTATNAACAEPARWVRAHGTDVSRQAGLRSGVLWRLPGATQ